MHAYSTASDATVKQTGTSPVDRVDVGGRLISTPAFYQIPVRTPVRHREERGSAAGSASATATGAPGARSGRYGVRVLHRLLVYWGMRDDPELDDQWAAHGVDRHTRLLGLPLGVAVLACVLALVDLFSSLVAGAGLDPGDAASDGLRWAGAILGLLVVGSIATRLVSSLRTRSQR